MKDIPEGVRDRIVRKLEAAENNLNQALELARKYWPEAIGFVSGEPTGLLFNVIRSHKIRDSINGQPGRDDCVDHDCDNDWDCGAW